MKVNELMTSPARTCHMQESLARAAQLMWDYECGALPVLNDRGDPIAMLTDRDICMAAYTQGKRLCEIPVMAAASHHLRSVRPDDSVAFALSVMRDHAVRRLPVVDIGGNLVGIVSLADFARAKRANVEPTSNDHFKDVATSLAEVCRPHSVHP